MKKIIHSLLLNSIVAGALLTSCQSNQQKVEDTQMNVADAKQQLAEAQQQVNPAYPAFKKDAEIKIADNDKHIADLRAKLGQPGKSTMDDMRRQKIDGLEKRNADLKAELYDYEKHPSDWERFKLRFNHDSDNLRDAFHDFGNDMKK